MRFEREEEETLVEFGEGFGRRDGGVASLEFVAKTVSLQEDVETIIKKR